MGQNYEIKCSACDYRISVSEGVGMADSPHAVFYGRCDDPSQNWSIACPDGFCEEGIPNLSKYVKSKRIKEKAFALLSQGAKPADDYGYEMYHCPKCMRLENRFYFRLKTFPGKYEPEYKCPKCKGSLQRVELKEKKDNRIEVVNKNGSKADWKCPKCGNNCLVFDGIEMLWD